MRFSPSLQLAKELSKKFKVFYFDPYQKNNIGNIKKISKLKKLREFDAIIFSVKHKDFKNITFKNIKIKQNAIVYDSNLVLTSKQINEFKYKKILFKKVGIN